VCRSYVTLYNIGGEKSMAEGEFLSEFSAPGTGNNWNGFHVIYYLLKTWGKCVIIETAIGYDKTDKNYIAPHRIARKERL